MEDKFEKEREQLHRNVMNSVSHDLKTPLACIIGSLEIYERTKGKLSPEKADELLATALHEAYRLDSFINNILDMAKLENRVVKVKREQCLMQKLIDDCLLTMTNILRDVTVTVKISPENFSVNTDATLLQRAICIVLDNAAKYCPPYCEVAVEADLAKGLVSIHISDNGLGIPEAEKEAIFSKYTRLAKQDYQRAGTGLGLPICRAIMELLGGTATVANGTKAQGAVFTLTLPA
jgi:two-component system sensor histidine kinase KdpD